MSKSSKKDLPVEVAQYDIYDIVTQLIDSLGEICFDSRDLTPRIDDKLIARLLPEFQDVEAVNAYYRMFIKPIVGTKTAVDSIFKVVNDVGQIKEWFTNSLTPFHFAIEYERIPEEIDVDRIIELAEWLKNERSHLATIRTPLCGYAFKWEASRWDKDFWDNIEGQKWKNTNVYVCFSVRDEGYDYFKFDPYQMTTMYYGHNLGYIYNNYHDWDVFTWDNLRRGEFVRQVYTYMLSNATYLSRPAITYPSFDKVNGVWRPRTFLDKYDFIDNGLKLKKLPAVNHEFFISPNNNQEILYSPEIVKTIYTLDYLNKISINASWTRDECYEELENGILVKKHHKIWNSAGGKPLEFDIKKWDFSNYDYQILNQIRDRLLLTAINNVYLLSSLHLSLESRHWDKKEPYSVYRDPFTKVEPRLTNEALVYQTSHTFRKDPLQKVYKSKYRVFHPETENDTEAEVSFYDEFRHNSFQWDNSISDDTLWDNQVIDVVAREIAKENEPEPELIGIESFIWDVSSTPDDVLFDAEDLYAVEYEIERILKEPILPDVIIKKFGDLVFNERLWYLLNEETDYDVSYKVEFIFNYARLNLRKGTSFELAPYMGFVSDFRALTDDTCGVAETGLAHCGTPFWYDVSYPLTVTTPFNIQYKVRFSFPTENTCGLAECGVSPVGEPEARGAEDFPHQEWFEYIKENERVSNDFCGEQECGVIHCGMPALLTNINQEVFKYNDLDTMPYPAFERTSYTHFYSMYNKARYSLGLDVRHKFNHPGEYPYENYNGLGRNVYDKWMFNSEYKARTGEAHCNEERLGLTISNVLLRDLYTWDPDIDSSFSIYIRTAYAGGSASKSSVLDKPILSEGQYPYRPTTHIGEGSIEYLPDPYSSYYLNSEIDLQRDLTEWVEYTDTHGYEVDITEDSILSVQSTHTYGSNWDAFLYEKNTREGLGFSLHDFDLQGIPSERTDLFLTNTLSRGNDGQLISHDSYILDNVNYCDLPRDMETIQLTTFYNGLTLEIIPEIIQLTTFDYHQILDISTEIIQLTTFDYHQVRDLSSEVYTIHTRDFLSGTDFRRLFLSKIDNKVCRTSEAEVNITALGDKNDINYISSYPEIYIDPSTEFDNLYEWRLRKKVSSYTSPVIDIDPSTGDVIDPYNNYPFTPNYERTYELEFQFIEPYTSMVHTRYTRDDLSYENLYHDPIQLTTFYTGHYEDLNHEVDTTHTLDNLSLVSQIHSVVLSQEALDLIGYNNLTPRIHDYVIGVYLIAEFPGWIRGGEIDIDDPVYANMDIDDWEQDPDRVTNVPPPIIYQNVHVDVNEQTIFVGDERYSVYRIYDSVCQVALYSSLAEARIESPYDIDVDGYYTEVDIDDPRFADVDIDSFTYDADAVARRNSGYSINTNRSPEVWNIDIRNIIIDDIDAMGDSTVDDINLADIDSDSIKVQGKDINLNLYKGLPSENFEEMGAIEFDIDIEQDIDVDALDIEDIDTFQPDIDLDTLLADFDIDSRYIDVDANASYLIVVDTVYNSVFQYESLKSFSTSVYQNIRYVTAA